MKKYCVSCIAVVTFGLMFAWLALAFSTTNLGLGVAVTSGYDILKAGTGENAGGAFNARYVFMLLSIIFGGLAVFGACGASLQAAKKLKVKLNLNMCVVCLLCVAALMAVCSTISGFCIEIPEAVKDLVKVGAGAFVFPIWMVLGACASFLFRKAK